MELTFSINMTNQKKSIISENTDMDGNGKADILDYVLLSSLFSEESGGKNKKSK